MKRHVAVTVAFALAAAATAYFGFFFFRDNFSTHYPMKVISAASFRSGEIPYWDVHAPGGQPLAGNPNSLTFYPDNVLYLLLPAHVAFNLHFLLHLAAGFLVMRALCLARGCSAAASSFASTVYVLSGVVISSTAFYNLVVAVAMLPLALYAVERRSARILGCAFGLMLLAAEPITLVAATVAVAIASVRRMRFPALLGAVLLALVIGSPQILAFSEIASEVERTRGMSAETVLATALTPRRVAEIFVWPFSGVLNEAGDPATRARLFSTIFLGIIAIPALFQRSRYAAIAAAMLFFAIAGNPLVRAAVENFESLRIGRYPEKFALPLVVALVVLIAHYWDASRLRTAWAIVTLLPLVWVAARALPIDWFAPYDVAPVRASRVYREPDRSGRPMAARAEYRQRARDLEPLFGAVAGLRYTLLPSPDRMYSTLTRTAYDRFVRVRPEVRGRYLQIASAEVPGALPMAMVVPRTREAASLRDAVVAVEDLSTDPRRVPVAPRALQSAPGRVVSYRERGQTIEVDVEASGPALVMISQTYFTAWRATLDGREVETMPLNIDRLGVLVPGSGRIALRFGRNRAAVAVAWLASLLLLLAVPVAERVEERNRRSREVERPGDEDRPFSAPEREA